jgi:hypothetical protein
MVHSSLYFWIILSDIDQTTNLPNLRHPDTIGITNGLNKFQRMFFFIFNIESGLTKDVQAKTKRC